MILKTIKYLSLILASIINQIHIQAQEARIETNFEFANTDMNFVMEINGVDVSETGKTFAVPVNQNGLDTIKYRFNHNPSSWAIMRLKQNVDYVLNSNTCSFYTIQPKTEAKQGMIRFRINSTDTAYYWVGIAGLDMRKLNKDQIDEFYYTPPSAMCPYAAKPIEIQTIDNKTIQKIRFHFLHGELVGIVYNKPANSIELNLHGYIRDKRDYRYRYESKK